MRKLLFLFLVTLCGAGPGGPWAARGEPTPIAAGISQLRNDGGRVDWSKGNRLAFDSAGPDGFFDVYISNADSSGERCLTCDHPDLPNMHIGNPAWHPSEEWIVMQVQKSSTLASIGQPGFGINNDLWVVHVQSGRVRQIRDLRRAPLNPQGTLHPHFSQRGDRLLWAERLGNGGFNGIWVLYLADFSIDGGEPRLQNIVELRPGPGLTFYESHGFSPDDSQILFSGAAGSLADLEIYRMDINSGAVVNLTNSPGQWDEHAQWSPDGRMIVWMSNRDQAPPAFSPLKTDYWIMNSDGGQQRRLTWFNDPRHPEYLGRAVAAADSSWSPDGARLAGFVITDNAGEAGVLITIDLVAPATSVSAASFAESLSPDSLASIFSRNMAVAFAAADRLPLPTRLGGVEVRIVDFAGAQHFAPLVAVTGGQVNYLAPPAAALGTAQLTVLRDGYITAQGQADIRRTAPALFSMNSDGRGVAAGFLVRSDPDGSERRFPVFRCSGGAGTCTTTPLDLGPEGAVNVLEIFGTGFRLAGDDVTATIDGTPVQVWFAGGQPSFAGLDQVNLLVQRTSGVVQAQIIAAGVPSNIVTLEFR